MKIYTRTGDKGSASLFTGERRMKTDKVFNALGTIDELSCGIGLALSHMSERIAQVKIEEFDLSRLRNQLLLIQCRLQEICSCVASPMPKFEGDSSLASISEGHTRCTRVSFSVTAVHDELEVWIDDMTGKLSPLRNFILPSGGVVACSLHVARTVCRRAERCIVAVNELHAPRNETPVVDQSVCSYINRLSDYLFTAARFTSVAFGEVDEVYKKPE